MSLFGITGPASTATMNWTIQEVIMNYFRIRFKARAGHASATTASVTNVGTVLLVDQLNDFINYSLGN